MRARLLAAAAVWSTIAVGTTALAQPAAEQPAVRYFVENGIRYRETTATIRQPVREVRYIDQQQTCYQQRYRTDMQQAAYTTYAPVTQYECVARLHDWWRIFREPYVAYYLEPYTAWQPQTQTVTVPVTRREIVPYTQTVRVAVPELRFADREQVSRVALGPATESTDEPPRQLASQSLPGRTVLEEPPALTGRPATFVPVPRVAATVDPYSSRAFPGEPGWNAADTSVTPQATRIPGRPVSPAPRPYGGIARLEGDPPRFGTSTSTGTWQARRE